MAHPAIQYPARYLLPVCQADVAQVGLAILVQDVEWVCGQLLSGEVGHRPPRCCGHRWAEGERDSDFPKGGGVGSAAGESVPSHFTKSQLSKQKVWVRSVTYLS